MLVTCTGQPGLGGDRATQTRPTSGAAAGQGGQTSGPGAGNSAAGGSGETGGSTAGGTAQAVLDEFQRQLQAFRV